jgi:hypothetical protein
MPQTISGTMCILSQVSAEDFHEMLPGRVPFLAPLSGVVQARLPPSELISVGTWCQRNNHPKEQEYFE